jgi:hypothetical protein
MENGAVMVSFKVRMKCQYLGACLVWGKTQYFGEYCGGVK